MMALKTFSSRCTLKLIMKPSLRKYSLQLKSPELWKVSAEVIAAFKNNIPVVALESTIITHGMPYPHNFRTAREVEQIIRECGAAPATIAILKGKVHVGLDTSEMEYLAEGNMSVTKTSRRDLPYVLSKGLYGGTTVSATMLLAHRLGISVFVTGGIGGVHRGAEHSMDISADLTELGRTPIAVVCAGVKSILDIGKTLEYLETQGVCVATFGDTPDFPAFFTPKSNFKAPCNVKSIEEAAKLIATSQDLGLENGILITVPIPADHAADGNVIEAAIQRSIKDARDAEVFGRAVTPFILDRVNKLTDGKSLSANVALIKSNARVGGQIAVSLAKMRSQMNAHYSSIRKFSTGRSGLRSSLEDTAPPVVIGGSIVDFIVTLSQKTLKLNGGTHRGRIIQALGGVGRNLCEALQRLGPIPPVFLSVVGQDPLAQFLNARFPHKENLRLRYVEECATATYTCILDQSGECLFGVGDMDIHNHITPQYVSAFKETIKMAPILIMDGNVPIETMDYVLQVCQEARVPVWFEPTDIHKASRPFQTNNWKALSYVSPNVQELVQMNAAVTGKNEDITISSEDLEDLLLQVTDLALPLLETIYVVLVTLGSHGILVLRRHKSDAPFPLKTNPVQVMEDISAIHYPTNPIENLVSVSGSGDCLAAAFISGALRGLPFNQCAMAAIRAASMSLKSPYTVPDELTFDAVFNNATGSQKTSQSQL